METDQPEGDDMATGPLTWTEQQIRKMIEDAVFGRTYAAESPPGWRSWGDWALWRIAGLLDAVHRWRARALAAEARVVDLTVTLDRALTAGEAWQAKAMAAKDPAARH